MDKIDRFGGIFMDWEHFQILLVGIQIGILIKIMIDMIVGG